MNIPARNPTKYKSKPAEATVSRGDRKDMDSRMMRKGKKSRSAGCEYLIRRDRMDFENEVLMSSVIGMSVA
jgi:hypothetical protein